MLVVILAGGAATAGFAVTRKAPSRSAANAPVLKTVAVTSGDLSTNEKIDGTLEVSNSLTVLHRIEGQTSSASTAATASATASGTSSATSSAASATAGAASAGAAQGSSGAGLEAAVVASRLTTRLLDVVEALATGDQPCPSPSGCSTPAGGAPSATTIPSPTGTDATTAPATTTPGPTTDATTSTTDPSAAATGTTVGGAPTGAGGSTGVNTPPAVAGGAAATSSGTGSAATATPTPTGTRTTQTVTSVIGAGSTVGLGDVLYTVGGQPVIALSGALPAWRTLSTSSTNGPDIQQLENSLVSLGYDPTGTVTVDGHFDSHTKAMVKRWQTGLGIAATGSVPLGSVVFLPTGSPNGTTVSSVSTTVGAAVGDGDPIVALTTDTQDVVIDVPSGDETFIVAGLTVQLGSDTGTVTLLRSIERDSAVVVQAVIAPATPITGASNGATVKVTITTDSVPGVLIVPADALLSRLDGSYAVQVRATDGAITWHRVDLLGVSGNKVGIRGDGVAAGTLVLVPV